MSLKPPEEAATTRSPSIRIRFLLVPIPRMFSAERPLTPLELPPLPTLEPVLPISEGSWVTVTKMLVLACFSNSAALMTVVGVGASKPPLMMREDDTVTDSSSRIMSGGFDAPTPTTVINAEELEKQANTNIFVTVTQLPSLMGSTGSSVGNGGSSNGVNGLSALNIRGIGTNRNLILIDGERVVAASSGGFNDISQFPQMLVQRVDVVTGGASASW